MTIGLPPCDKSPTAPHATEPPWSPSGGLLVFLGDWRCPVEALSLWEFREVSCRPLWWGSMDWELPPAKGAI